MAQEFARWLAMTCCVLLTLAALALARVALRAEEELQTERQRTRLLRAALNDARQALDRARRGRA